MKLDKKKKIKGEKLTRSNKDWVSVDELSGWIWLADRIDEIGGGCCCYFN